jgi:Protein of unknown function (DUF1553)/Protein of unknown function (DUF1549)
MWLTADNFYMVRLLGKHAIDMADNLDVVRVFLCGLSLLSAPKAGPEREAFDWKDALIKLLVTFDLENQRGIAASAMKQCEPFARRLAELPLAKLAPRDENHARSWLTGIIDQELRRLHELRLYLQVVAQADEAEAPARLAFETGPEGDRQRRYGLSAERLVSKRFGDFLKTRGQIIAGTFDPTEVELQDLLGSASPSVVSGPLSVDIPHSVQTETLDRGELLTRSVSEESGCDPSLRLRFSVGTQSEEYGGSVCSSSGQGDPVDESFSPRDVPPAIVGGDLIAVSDEIVDGCGVPQFLRNEAILSVVSGSLPDFGSNAEPDPEPPAAGESGVAEDCAPIEFGDVQESGKGDAGAGRGNGAEGDVGSRAPETQPVAIDWTSESLTGAVEKIKEMHDELLVDLDRSGLAFEPRTNHCLTLAEQCLEAGTSNVPVCEVCIEPPSGEHRPGGVSTVNAGRSGCWNYRPLIAVLGERASAMFDRGSFLERCTISWPPWLGRPVLAGWALAMMVLFDAPVCRADPPVSEAPVATVVSSGSPAVSFRNGVVPLLTKLGCNQGACHGGQHGKGGFKLSLLGFEPDVDFTAIAKSAEGRRITPFAPEESLLLLKPTLAVAHGGGKKMEIDSPAYRLLTLWLEQGARGPRDDDPRVVGVKVSPDHRRMEPGQEQQLAVFAMLSDGSETDVTRDARFDTLNEGVATVRPSGLAKTVGKGEANIMVRYQGHAAMARLTVPFATEKAFDFPSTHIIDARAADRWRELGLVPSPPCTDAEFLRRAMLDVIGTVPTPDEVEEFLSDNDPGKRDKLVDRLLDRPEYVDFWTLKWGDVLRVNSEKLGAQGMLAFNLWLRESFRGNKPVSRMVDELVTAQGSIFSHGPANFFRIASSPDDLAETTAQVFMGVRLQCAKCHHHPFEAYGQDDYYALAAYFARVRTKGSDEFGLFGREQVVYVAKSGEVRQPRSGKTMVPRPLGGSAADDPVDRRRALASWLLAEKRHWLARNVVNRYWGYLMGKGLVNPIDDLRDTNPPTNPELLDALAGAFVASGYDLKALLRLILTSRVYQLSALTTPDNRLDRDFFTHYTIKRLTAEQLLDAIDAATGTVEKFPKLPAGTRAISVPDTTYASFFLDTFGRPLRAIACECERSSDPNLSQALNMMNGELLNRKLFQADGRLMRLLKDPKLTDGALALRLYLLTVNRPPTASEVVAASGIFAEGPSRQAGAQDLFWALLNSREFLFNH